MPEACNEKEIIYQNLIDIGCSHQQITDCIKLMNEKDYEALLKILKIHRIALMDCVHEGQKKVDYLDFLVNKIEKEINR